MRPPLKISRIAMEAGLSKSTVSYMVKNIDSISKESRNHILRAVQKLELDHDRERSRVTARI